MAILLLLSTTSWKVEKHYCMGRLINTALFIDVADCGMNMDSSNTGQNMQEAKNSCCDNEVVFIDGQDNLNISLSDLDFNLQSFILAFGHSYKNLFNIKTEQFVPHKQYPPPILVKNIQLLDEVFLI